MKAKLLSGLTMAVSLAVALVVLNVAKRFLPLNVRGFLSLS